MALCFAGEILIHLRMYGTLLYSSYVYLRIQSSFGVACFKSLRYRRLPTLSQRVIASGKRLPAAREFVKASASSGVGVWTLLASRPVRYWAVGRIKI